MSTMIRLKSISKIYRSLEVETTAVDELDLEINTGDFLAIMGPSGCGKSTLLNMLGLLDRPDSGTYHFADKQVFPASDRDRDAVIRNGIGFVFQNFNLIDDLSIYDNVQLPLIYKKWSSAKRKKVVNDTLDRMGIGHRANHKPQQLSGGQQQRVALARAIIGDPAIILADEPTGNLDSVNGKAVMEILSELNRDGKTIVMVTHSEHDAAYALSTMNMSDGKLFVK